MAADAVCVTTRGKTYVKRHTVNKDARSADQLIARGQFASLPSLWRSLPANIRTLCDRYAAEKALSGWNWFASVNAKALADGLPMPCIPRTTAPTNVLNLTCTPSFAAIIVTATLGAANPDDYAVILSAPTQQTIIDNPQPNVWSLHDAWPISLLPDGISFSVPPAGLNCTYHVAVIAIDTDTIPPATIINGGLAAFGTALAV